MSETTYLVRLKGRYRFVDSLGRVQWQGAFAERPRPGNVALFQKREEAEAYCRHIQPPPYIYPFSWDQVKQSSWQIQFIDLLAKYSMPPLWPFFQSAQRPISPSANYPENHWIFFRHTLDAWWQMYRRRLSPEQYRAIWRFADPEPYDVVPISLDRDASATDRWLIDEHFPAELLENYARENYRRRNPDWDLYEWNESEMCVDDNSEGPLLSPADIPLPLSVQMGDEWPRDIDPYSYPTEEPYGTV